MNIAKVLSESIIFLRKSWLGFLRGNDSMVAARLRRAAIGTKCTIDTHVFVTNRKNFEAGRESALYHGCYILNPLGRFALGDRSHLGAFCYVNVCYGNVKIGDDVAVGPGTKIIVYSNHYEKGKKVTDVRVTKDVTIGNNVFVGANCAILPGTVINDNVVVAAGSVVKGELDANAVYGGVPCKKLKERWYE